MKCGGDKMNSFLSLKKDIESGVEQLLSEDTILLDYAVNISKVQNLDQVEYDLYIKEQYFGRYTSKEIKEIISRYQAAKVLYELFPCKKINLKQNLMIDIGIAFWMYFVLGFLLLTNIFVSGSYWNIISSLTGIAILIFLLFNDSRSIYSIARVTYVLNHLEKVIRSGIYLDDEENVEMEEEDIEDDTDS
jgi:hypothetical protein